MLVQIVRFKSTLPEDQLLKVAENRAPQFRAVNGLVQKYYLRFRETGEFGAVYLWESEEAVAKFRESELFKSIPSAYQVQGKPDVQMADLALTLRPEPAQHEKAKGA